MNAELRPLVPAGEGLLALMPRERRSAAEGFTQSFRWCKPAEAQAPVRLRSRFQSLVDDRHQLVEQLLRQVGIVENLRRQVCRGVHRPDHRREEFVVQVRAGGELGQRVVLGLLLQVWGNAAEFGAALLLANAGRGVS